MYPALAVLQAVIGDNSGITWDEISSKRTLPGTKIETISPVLWVGGIGGMEADLVKRVGIPYEAVPAAGLHGVGLRVLPGNLLKLGKGYIQSRQILKRFNPDVLFFTGGYVAVPMALAGRKVPSLLFVPDIEPGVALKTLARLADSIDLSVDASHEYFKRHPNVRVTGYPTRSNLKSWSLESAHKALGLDPDLHTLLVLGGSKGARSINQALLKLLPELLKEMQVVHISGELDWSEVEAVCTSLKDSLLCAERYKPFPYLHHEMGAALTAADLVVSRAGASCLGEYPLFGLPAILVPYPYTWRYQEVNAQYLSEKGAAEVVPDEEMATQLLPKVRELMTDDIRREQMRQAMRTLVYPNAAESIASHLSELAALNRERD